MSKISVFPRGKKSTKTGKYVPATTPFNHIEFDDYLSKIQDGEYQDEVLQYRAGKLEKGRVRGVTASGTFSYRSAKNIIQHSGFLAIDIDEKDQPSTVDLIKLKEDLEKDAYTYSTHNSLGGRGLVVYVKVVPERHIDAFLGIEKYYLDNYGAIIDQACKDVSRFRYVSYDPDLFLNRKSKTFKAYIPKKVAEPKRTYIYSDNDLEHVFKQISENSIDLTNDYSDWYKIACALADHYGESGRNYFHDVSQNSPKYDSKACDDLFDIILKRNHSKKATIASFLWLASNAGVEIKTKRTEHVERVAKMRRKKVGANGGFKDIKDATEDAIKYLSDIDDVHGKDVLDVIDQVMKLPENEALSSSGDLLSDLEAFLKTFDLRFNEITRNYELNGKQMEDRDYNSLYIEAKRIVDVKINKDLLFSMIDSDNTPSYHPFKEFFEKYKNLKPEGNFQKLCDCIVSNQISYMEEERVKLEYYVETYLKKWMLGIIASMNGTYSLTVLVLTGGQRAGKTKFFRNLLPDELMTFYAESKLDDGKDSHILMTQKIIIMDDEFAGKSKQDAKRMKELSSKQWFNLRRPYGRTNEDVKRLAVLCGTSNDEEIINDPTGNRRIIPMNIESIDHEAMEEIDKVALFMELYNEWKTMGDDWMLSKKEIEVLNMATLLNEQPSIEQEMIMKYFVPTDELEGNAIALTNTELKSYIEVRHPSLRVSPYNLGLVLKKLGYEKRRMRVHGSHPKLVYLLNELYKG